MNPPDSLESLWGDLSTPVPPPVETVLRKAQTVERRERREMRFAGLGVLAASAVVLSQLYILWPHPASWLMGAIVLFLWLSTWRLYRYQTQLKAPPTLDTQTYLTRLRDQKDGAQALQRFIFRVYIPVLGTGIVATMWVFLWGQPLWMPLVATLLTVAWIAFTAWWGKKRQARKYQQIDELLRSLGADDLPTGDEFR